MDQRKNYEKGGFFLGGGGVVANCYNPFFQLFSINTLMTTFISGFLLC